MTRTQLEALAQFWDSRESESLHVTTLVGELTEVVDGCLGLMPEPDRVEAVIRDLAPFRVAAYVKKHWTDGAIDVYAAGAIEHLCERFDDDEDFGCPDESLSLTAAAREELMVHARALVRALVPHASPWCCDRIGTVDVEADEAVALMRTANPHWFESVNGPEPGSA
jgi:hypothetical protein